jgi:hypothetical protein
MATCIIIIISYNLDTARSRLFVVEAKLGGVEAAHQPGIATGSANDRRPCRGLIMDAPVMVLPQGPEGVRNRLGQKGLDVNGSVPGTL